jgi:hypothetical protein
VAPVPALNNTVLKFQLSRRDLYGIVRINAARRVFRKVAVPLLSGFVFLGHSLDGEYLEGLVWAVGVAVLYWGASNIMYILNVYGAANETLLVPQEITLHEDRMVVNSEHSTEDFARPDPADVKAGDRHLVITMDSGSLVFLKRSFKTPGDFQVLKDWMISGPSGREDTETRRHGEKS